MMSVAMTLNYQTSESGFDRLEVLDETGTVVVAAALPGKLEGVYVFDRSFMWMPGMAFRLCRGDEYVTAIPNIIVEEPPPDFARAF